MGKGDRLGVECLARAGFERRRGRPAAAAAATTLEAIGGNRVAEPGEVDAELMRAAGLGRQPEQGGAAEALDDLEARHGGPSTSRPRAHALALPRMAPDGLIDDTGGRTDHAVDDRD